MPAGPTPSTTAPGGPALPTAAPHGEPGPARSPAGSPARTVGVHSAQAPAAGWDEVVLDGPVWRARAAAHRERVAPWTLPHRDRRRRGETHPVLDFLFTYYSHRPAQLEQWHPGPGIALRDADELLALPGHVRRPDGTVALTPAALPDRHRTTAAFVRALLVATASRPARLSCFGLHEWAMVYRTEQEGGAPRHAGVPLRLGAAGTDAVVESLPVHCTHHDAYRFFTAAARPRNAVTPTRADQLALEQPGCLHAGMDLYKWAYKLSPATSGELVAGCFTLAADIRTLDMRASPYDLAHLGHRPVRIETPAGRAEYARAQADLARRAAPLRTRLIDLCGTVLGDTVVGDTVLGDTVLGDTVLGDTVLGDTVLGDTVLGDTVLGDTVLGDAGARM